MKKQLLKILFIFNLFIILNSCASDYYPILSNDDFLPLQKGMKYNEIDKIFDLHNKGLKDKERVYEFNCEVENQNYLCIGLAVPTYMYSEKEPEKYKKHYSKNQFYFNYYRSVFFLVLQDSTLLNFGYLYQLKNHENIQLNKIAYSIDTTFLWHFSFEETDSR